MKKKTAFVTDFRWQARKEGDKNLRAGLIPSKLLQERRITLERTNAENEPGLLSISYAIIRGTEIKRFLYKSVS